MKASLWRRLLHLGGARIASLGSRALLFFSFAHVLDPKRYGIVALLLSLSTFASLILELGLGPALLKKGAEDADANAPLLGGVLLLRLASLLPILLLYCWAAWGFLGSQFSWGLACAVGLFALVYQIGQTVVFFLRGSLDTRLEAYAGALLHTVEMVLIILWWIRGDASLLLWLFGAFVALRCAYVFLLHIWLLRVFALRFHWQLVRSFYQKHKSAIAVYLLLSLLQFTYIQADVLLLKWLRSTEEVGRYWACYRQIVALFIPVDLLLAVVLPRLAVAATRERINDIYNGMHLLSACWVLPVLACLFLHCDTLLSVLLGASFRAEPDELRMVFLIVAAGIGVAYLPPFGGGFVVQKHPEALLKSSFFAALVNILLGLWWIPRFGAVGAAWSTVCSYLVLKGCFWWIFRARSWQAMPFEILWMLLVVLVWSGICWWWRLSLPLSLLVLGAFFLGWFVFHAREYRSLIEGKG